MSDEIADGLRGIAETYTHLHTFLHGAADKIERLTKERVRLITANESWHDRIREKHTIDACIDADRLVAMESVREACAKRCADSGHVNGQFFAHLMRTLAIDGEREAGG